MPNQLMYTILIVDDNAQNLFALRSLLESSLNANVLEAMSGLAALEKVSQYKIDLILLDIQMPDINGFEVAKLIRNRKRYCNIPIIFLTGIYKTDEFKQRGLEGGGIDYLTKPVDDTILINRVRAYLRVIEDERNLNLQLEESNRKLQEEVEERKRIEELLRQREEQLELFFSESLDGCFFMMLDTPVKWDDTTDKEQVLEYVFSHQRITKANEAMLYQYDIPLSQFLGMTPQDFFAHDVEYGKSFWRQLFDQGRLYIESDQCKRDGTHIWIEGNYICLYDEQGRITGHFGIQRDITGRKQAETALKSLNEELEQRVEERTAELQRTNLALQESLETLRRAQEQLIQSEKMAALGALVAGVSHEISTPIGVGVTAASNLQEKTRELQIRYDENSMTRSDLEKYLHIAVESAELILKNLQRAAEQMHGFKQVAVDQTSGEKRAFNLKTYIEEVLRSLHPKLKRTKHTVSVEGPEDIECHSYPGAFSQIITNFVMNSLIHGFEHQEQGQIVIEIRRENGNILLRYSDNGRGMPEEERSRIFEPFYTTKREQGGSGLGLNIIHNLVSHQLNGSIECQSEPGKGTTFIIQLPNSCQEGV
ncbi:PAS/PAC sensor signal transduction histidine kinase [Candidatus Vecturithrix granuli]|uniref:histidine kinase n=1 Tax=Vecturithrix granuli TaxID=1499967 RepID=A0A081C035_VECG1|nr:PAS/PAC sensor signal transduction histidine kinase [Candidatus Vecturithrix granuli]